MILSFALCLCVRCFRDALLVCVGDTLMSVMSGFAVFAMVGVLSETLGASVKDVIQSGSYLRHAHSPDLQYCAGPVCTRSKYRHLNGVYF